MAAGGDFYLEDDIQLPTAVNIKMLGISKDYYTYLRILIEQSGQEGGGPFETVPASLLGNIINTNMNECPVAITSDGKYFFFTRDYKENPKDYDGIPSIYFIETKALQLETLF